MSSPVLSAIVNVPLPFRLSGESIFLKALRWSIIDEKNGTAFNGKDMRKLIEELLRHWRGGTHQDFFNSRMEIVAAQGSTEYPVNLLNTQWAGGDWVINQHIFGSLAYEPDISALLQLTVSNTDTFLDVGANWGYCAAFLALRDGFRGQIHAFEPMPESFEDLSGLITALNLTDRVQCHELALSNQDGNATLSSPWWSGNASLNGNENGIQVKTARLDGLNLTAPRLIKIDVEGAEAMVIAGAENTIRTHQPLVIFESQKDEDHSNSDLYGPLNIMRDYGYDLFYAKTTAKGMPELVMERLTHTSLLLEIFPLGDRFGHGMPKHMNVFAVPRGMPIAAIASVDADQFAVLMS